MGVIYIIRNLITNKSYIGQTKYTVEKRYKSHISSFKIFSKNLQKRHCCIALYTSMKKHGLNNFVISKILECENDKLDKYEKFYIKVFNSLCPNGYNIRTGGYNGKHCAQSREKMRKSKLGSNNPNYGKPRSESFKKIMSEKKSKENHHFWKKELSIKHKLNLSKSHKFKNENYSNTKMYICYIKPRPKYYQYEGYVVIHPSFKRKYFTSKKYKLEEKYKMAEDYLYELLH